MKVEFDTRNLLRFVRRLDHASNNIDIVVSGALNEAGDALVHHVVHDLSRETGFTTSQAERFLIVSRANKNRKEYTIRILHGMMEAERITRRMPGRPWEKKKDAFDNEMLIKILTSGDAKVCHICKRIEAEGPYSPDELRQLKLEHPHFLNPDLGCRCSYMPYRPKQKIAFKAKQGRTTIDMSATLNQLAQTIRKNVTTILKVK